MTPFSISNAREYMNDRYADSLGDEDYRQWKIALDRLEAARAWIEGAPHRINCVRSPTGCSCGRDRILGDVKP